MAQKSCFTLVWEMGPGEQTFSSSTATISLANICRCLTLIIGLSSWFLIFPPLTYYLTLIWLSAWYLCVSKDGQVNLIILCHSRSYSHTQYPLILALPQSMGLYSAGLGKQLSVVKVPAAFAHVAVTASLNTALVWAPPFSPSCFGTTKN